MNFLSNFFKITLITLAVIGSSCSREDETGDVILPTNTIAYFVDENEDYSTLAAALRDAGLMASLDGTVNYTLFAPNDAAFNSFLSSNDFNSLDDVPDDVLRVILLNHIQQEARTSNQLTTGYVENLAIGTSSDRPLSTYISNGEEIMINDIASLTATDIEVDNGIIHFVDAVIELPELMDFITIDPDLDMFLQAISREDNDAFINMLNTADESAPFTLFIPTNDAFYDLFDELGVDSLDDIETETLTAILSAHLVTRNNINSADLEEGTEIETYGGALMKVQRNVNNNILNLIDLNARTSRLISSDIQTTNGVIHVMDTVLLPEME